jgi:hypothetical protein
VLVHCIAPRHSTCPSDGTSTRCDSGAMHSPAAWDTETARGGASCSSVGSRGLKFVPSAATLAAV